MLMTGNFSNDIVKAVYEVSGKKYRIGIYNDEHSEAKPKKRPVRWAFEQGKGARHQCYRPVNKIKLEGNGNNMKARIPNQGPTGANMMKKAPGGSK